MPIKVLSITEADIPGAVKCIQDAFAEDPYADWQFDRKTFSKVRNSVSLTIRCRWGMDHAMFHVAKDSDDPSGKILGVACWLPPKSPGQAQSWFEYIGDWKLWLRQVRMNLVYGRGGLNVKRYYIWKTAQAEAHKALWTDSNGYYFCNIVAVSPDAQGKGIGRMLFKEVTNVADREGVKCYLESSRAVPNKIIYGKMGFSLAREMLCDDDGQSIKLYCMMREPLTKA